MSAQRRHTTSQPRVAFQGERGAFSEEAALRLLGADIELVPRPTFDSMFSTIEEDAADLILTPIENSLAGSIHRVFDLLLEKNLSVTAEVIHPIAHTLIGLPGATLEEITSIESHPVALAQCERLFQKYPRIKRIVAEDTAGSVRNILGQSDTHRAAIAAKRAAEIYGGKILLEHVEDHHENYTRFLLLERRPKANSKANKLSLVMHVSHTPGSLHRALGAFAQRGISLTKIESRPIPGKPWEYLFYLDLKASLADPITKAALKDLKKCTDTIRVLGCYPAYADATLNSKKKGRDAK